MAIDNGSPRRFGDDDATPQVAMRPRPWVVPLGVAGALLIGALVFWQLNANRARVDDARLTDPAPNAQQDAIGLENVPPPPDLGVLAQMTEQPLPGQTGLSAATAPPASSGMGQTTGQAETADQRNRSPALIVDLSEASQPR